MKDMPNTTATIQIGNSDNKLTQNEWAHFVTYTEGLIGEIVYRVHFFGGSESFAPWQNACWVVEMDVDKKDELFRVLEVVRKSYKQESIAVTFGRTEFVGKDAL